MKKQIEKSNRKRSICSFFSKLLLGRLRSGAAFYDVQIEQGVGHHYVGIYPKRCNPEREIAEQIEGKKSYLKANDAKHIPFHNPVTEFDGLLDT